MAEMIPTIVFYLFAAVALFSAVRVISAKNPVHSVLFLIMAFFSTAGLFILLGAEYIAMTLVIVYVGAVAVLFLFVVMMLDIDIVALREGFLRYLPIGLAVAVVVFVELFMAFSMSLKHPASLAAIRQPIPGSAEVSNTEAIGKVLYTYYMYPFQMSGIILLVAMVGAIVLTLRSRSGVRKQRISKQLARTAAEGLEVVNVESGRGID